MSISALLILFLFTSCSTLKRSMIGGSILGAGIGGAGGVTFSPDMESSNKNAYVFGLIGAAAGAGIAYLLHPQKKKAKQKTMIMDQDTDGPLQLFDFGEDLKAIRPEVKFNPVKKYQVPLTNKLPHELEGKVKKQFVIEYKTEAKTIKVGKRTIQIEPFKAWEHVYEE